MALTGLQIQKLLPQTNCKECGSNTCLAFAMKLAAKKAELSACPYASDEAKRVLGAAAEPPVRLMSLGKDGELKLGAETVLYRHEKTFVHQTAIAVTINRESDIAVIADYRIDRAGEQIGIDMAAVACRDADGALARTAWERLQKPLVLFGDSLSALKAAAVAVKGSRSVLASATPATVGDLRRIAAENGHALAITAPTLDELAKMAADLRATGFADFLLQLPATSAAEQFELNSVARRAALKDTLRQFGYPFLRFVPAADPESVAVETATEICKYGGICVLPSFDAALLAALLTLRLNIYTDPQKPIQVEPKLYPIGEPGPESPVFVTTNFSLTYFIVSSEIENAGKSAWLLVPECEGMSVLTAWAAGKFSGASIGRFAKEIGLDASVKTREIVIPGYVAQISGELEQAMPGWRAVVGPQDAADLESFIKVRCR